MELSPWPPPSEALATGEALTAPATPAMPIPALPAETVPTTEASGEALEAIPAEFAEDLMPPRPAHASYGPLRIGYLPRPAEGGLDEPLARRLAEALRQDQALRHALVAEGFSDSEDGDAAIVIQGADGFRDLANRLEHREFDVAFCPATVFVSLRNVRNEYRAILQERRPMDTRDPRGGGQILRQGVIFAGPASPFFQGEEPTTDTLKRLFRSEELVVPSAYDASGYFYPRLTLAGEFGVSPDRFRFAGSSRDTVKHVVSGLGAVGACDLGTIEHWLALEAAPDVPLDKMIRVLAYCPPHPTDPVIIRDELHPSISRAGRAINDALKAFFSRGARFALEPSKDDFFAGLAADYGRLDSLRRPGGPR